MAATWRRWLLASLVVVAALGSGCNLLSVPFFLLGPEPKVEPLLKKLASDSKDKEVKVVVLAYGGLETRPEFLRADRELSNLLVRQLKEHCKYNGEKVALVAPAKVEEFKNTHPDWHTMNLEDIGSRFDANYVIYLEINKLSLYETGSANLIYRGRADITVSLVDVDHPDEGVMQKEFTCEYPGDASGGVPIDDKNQRVFLAEFYKQLAVELSWHFTSHPTREDHEINCQ